ncbi:MAG: hypothetical protein ABIZ70_03060 [Gemmatimonadales bacterium]
MPEADLAPVPLDRVVRAGLAAGALDLVLALGITFAVRGTIVPGKVLQSIAAGAVGDAAKEGGVRIWAAGAVLHFTIALIWAAIYAFSTRRLPPVRSLRMALGPARTGLLFGLVVWASMRFIVVPLSHAPSNAFKFSAVMVAMVVGHMVMIGLPIALISERD